MGLGLGSGLGLGLGAHVGVRDGELVAAIDEHKVARRGAAFAHDRLRQPRHLARGVRVGVRVGGEG